MRHGLTFVAAAVSVASIFAMAAGPHSPATAPAGSGGATMPAATQPETKDAALWRLLEAGGQVVLMRPATTTPGIGDPPNFKLGDCSTQRNLSDAGRAQAKA